MTLRLATAKTLSLAQGKRLTLLVVLLMLLPFGGDAFAQDDAAIAGRLFALDQRSLHHARRAALLSDLPPHRAARFPRLQGPRSVCVLRRPRRPASARHRRSRRRAGAHVAGAVRGLEARTAAVPAPLRARAGEPRISRGAPRGQRQGRSGAARRAQRQHVRAGAAAQCRSGGHDLARAAAQQPRRRSAARAGRSQATRHLRRRSGQRSAARLHHRDRVGRRPRDQDLARTDAVLRRRSIHRRAGRRLRHPRARARRRRSPRAAPTRTACSKPGCPTSGWRTSSASRSAAIRSRPPIPDRGRSSSRRASWPPIIYTDKPIYRPGHTVHVKAILRWRQMDALAPFDRPDAGSRGVRHQRQGGVPPPGEAGSVWRGAGQLPGPGHRGARQLHDPHPERRRARQRAASRCRNIASRNSK